MGQPNVYVCLRGGRGELVECLRRQLISHFTPVLIPRFEIQINMLVKFMKKTTSVLGIGIDTNIFIIFNCVQGGGIQKCLHSFEGG